MNATSVTTTHRYTSTACIHDQHEACRRVCKFCQGACHCPCHEGQPDLPIVDLGAFEIHAKGKTVHDHRENYSIDEILALTRYFMYLGAEIIIRKYEGDKPPPPPILSRPLPPG